MRPGRRLPAAFFRRSPIEVAPDLLGCVLVRRTDDGTRLMGRLVEVEAYLGDGTDPAAHSHTGPNARNRTMFGPSGRLYAYLSYGIHTCVNVVCGPAGVGAGVLLRAAEPLDGEADMRRHRGLEASGDPRRVASGPGRLAQAFALGLEHDGLPFGAPPLSLHRPAAGDAPPRIVAGPRVGLSRAVELPYRFYIEGNRFVSGPRGHKSSERAQGRRGRSAETSAR